MLTNSSISKSVEEYVKLRLRDIPSELENSFLKTKQIWKCENEIDFIYGYYVGKLEEGTLHYLLKAKRAPPDEFIDSFEIRGIIETYRKELYDIISKYLSK